MLAEVEGSVHERSRDAALAGPRAQRRDVSPADCAARAEPSGLGGWAQADLPSPPPKSPKERVGGCVGALAHHKPHALPGAREARSRTEGVRRAGRPFPKCFSAPTGLRRACGPRGGARSMVASAPCRRPPARSFSATGDPHPHRVLGSLRRLPSPEGQASGQSLGLPTSAFLFLLQTPQLPFLRAKR